ncbi:hypothetical protein [Streptomyces sp. enrichment culture]|uniref:hypothetical protein n=1 Tax=Streptomyces sp. enrichment culture TaxID=1795815 RepID=UPI003F555E07
MTTQTETQARPSPPETGWATAQRLRGEHPLRTCLPAVAGRTGSATPRTDAEGNIVRGED